MKKLLLFTLLMALPLLASAQDYDIAVENADGVTIYYNYFNDGKELEVTNNGEESYSEEVNIPDEVTYKSRTRKVTNIKNYAFRDCTGLTSVTIPNSVTTIGELAFAGCINLTSATIGNSVTTIGASAFTECKSLTSVVIPNSVTTIGGGAFHNCASLTTMTIPNSVTSIGLSAFSDCTKLASATIGNSVTTIGDYVFYNCESLTSITIPNSITAIGFSAFWCCKSLASVTIGNSVTTIGGGAFHNCASLTSVTIPNGVTSIGEQAFSGCTKLASVTIPSSVTTIDKRAFYNCNSLATVVSKMEEPCSIDAECFDNDVFDNASLYVPKGTAEIYNKTDIWNKFIFVDDEHICATPTIGYGNKELTFSCETEGVEFVSKITDVDIKDFYTDRISLSATYEISVYATKAGYGDSDVATATLVWMSAQIEGGEPIVTPANAPTESSPVLISSRDGFLMVKSELEGQSVAVYSLDGKALGSARVKGGQAVIATYQPKGAIVVVKVGERSVKASL